MSFPVVPNLPGVPPLVRDPFSAIPTIALLIADFIGLGGVPFQQQWGIFRDGANVVACDNVVSFDYRQDWYLSTFPLEQGAFETYDKVETPFQTRVRFSGGQALLDSIAAIADDTNLYDVATPEVVYQNVNVVHYDFKRTSSQGVKLIVVDVWLMEVRENAQTSFTSTKTPSGNDAVNGGTVQPRAVPAGIGSDYAAAGGVQ